MGYKEIFAKISGGALGGVLIFYGPEEYSKDRALEALKAKLVPPDMEALNYLYLENDRANASEIRRAAETLPFMAEKRLVVVRDYPMLCTTHRGSGLDARQETAELELMTKRFPETTCLVFLMRAAVDTTKAAWKQLIRIADAVEFVRLTDDELVQQLNKLAKRAGGSIAREEARYMIAYCGADLETLSREVAKACAHAGDGQAVSKANITAVCVQTQESKAFRIIDSLYAGEGRAAMEGLRSLTGDPEAVSAALSLIERQARLMAAAKAAGQEANTRELVAQLGLQRTPFVMEAAMRQARRWSGEDLAKIVSLCLAADNSIKQGLTGEQTAVELLAMTVLQMASANK